MAKSLRSKIKRKHDTERRKKIYQPVEDERIRRLAAKQAEGTSLENPIEETVEEQVKLSDKEKQAALVNTISSKIVKREDKMKKFFQKQKEAKKARAEGINEDIENENNPSKFKKFIKPKKKLSAKSKLKW